MLLVVGGHSRNIGKTSVAAGIIRALPEAEWTAFKITQHGHGICSAAGAPCGCAIEYDHPYAIDEEPVPGPTDSGRFLAAGARKAYWVRTPVGQLGQAMTALRPLLGGARNAVVESNSLLDFVVPDLYLAVMDYSVADMKDSARRFLPRADALVVAGGGEQPWGVPARWLDRPSFAVTGPDYVSDGLVAFVKARLPVRR